MAPLRVLFISCSNAGVTYWRMFSWAEAMHRTKRAEAVVLGWDKHETDVAPWQFQIGMPQHQHKLFGMLYSAGVQADVIIFQRIESQWGLTTLYAMRDQFPNKPILSEIDDDILDIATYNPASEGIKPGSSPTTIALAQFKNSDALITTTPYLKDVYSEFCKHIYVVPNSVDVKKWDNAKRKKKPGIRIGWIGGASHVEDLRLLERVIPQVLRDHKDARFVFVSSVLPDFLKDLERVEVVEKWSPILKYPSHIAGLDFDIGLAPLRDNKFNRAKSNLRWLEYAALGIPCVASNVGHFKATLRHGQDCYLADDPEDFTTYINRLIDDSAFRKKMGRAAHARVVEDFNVDKNVEKYIVALKDVLSRPAMKAPEMVNGVDDIQALPIDRLDDPLPAGIEMSPLERIIE